MTSFTEPENIWSQHASRLAGGWKCISYHMYDSDSPSAKLIAKPHSDTPLGRVLISPSGYLSAHVARPDLLKPLPSGKPWQTGGDEEVAKVARGLSMYAGYLKMYEDEKGLYWKTKVEVCSDPSRLGGFEERRVRWWEEGGKEYAELRPKQDLVLDDGGTARAVLVWEKFE